jgi:pyridoxamine 5'-phosphate oxidase family protein
MASPFTPAELDFLRSQRLGRLATVDSRGAPQNNPVGFFLDPDSGDIVVGGLSMGTTRKFRNVQANGKVAFVVDELASVDPWVVRGVEVRGSARALEDTDPPRPGMSRAVIRITPEWVAAWGIDDGPIVVRPTPAP